MPTVLRSLLIPLALAMLPATPAEAMSSIHRALSERVMSRTERTLFVSQRCAALFAYMIEAREERGAEAARRFRGASGAFSRKATWAGRRLGADAAGAERATLASVTSLRRSYAELGRTNLIIYGDHAHPMTAMSADLALCGRLAESL